MSRIPATPRATRRDPRSRATSCSCDDIKDLFSGRTSTCTSMSGSPRRALHDSASQCDRPAVERLREQGHVFDDNEAVWVRTTDFGDDKDRVLIRSDGVYTYFAADAAYYLDKNDRGFSDKMYLLGADHHGYVGRLKAHRGCRLRRSRARHRGADRAARIKINGAKLSKRAGNIIELRRPRALARHATRCAFRSSGIPADSPLSLDSEVCCASARNDNPVFYVQYAHARTYNVERNAA